MLIGPTCTMCDFGKYKDKHGINSCSLCNEIVTGSTTMTVGSVSKTSCVCPAGEYMRNSEKSWLEMHGFKSDEDEEDRKQKNNLYCRKIPPEGVNKTMPAMNVFNLAISPGYWRDSNHSEDVRFCSPNSTACLGDDNCAEGHTGPYCAVCIDGYSVLGSSANGDLSCVPCSGDISRTINIVVSFFCVMMLVIIAFCFWRYRRGSLVDESMAASADFSSASGAFETIERKINAAEVVWEALRKLGIPLKILMAYAQIAAGFSFNFRLKFPASFSSIMKVFSFANFDFLSLAPLGCAVPISYHLILLCYTLGPLLVSVFLVTLYKILSLKKYSSADQKKNDFKNTVFYSFLLFTFFILPTVSMKVLNTFNCDHFDGGGTALIPDLSIDCKSSTHKFFESYAIGMAVVFPFGIPLMYAVMLYRVRDALNPGQGQEKLINTCIVKLLEEVPSAGDETNLPSSGQFTQKNVVKEIDVIFEKAEVENAISTALNSGLEITPLNFEVEFRDNHLALYKYATSMKNVNRKFWRKMTVTEGDNRQEVERTFFAVEVTLDEDGALKEAIRQREKIELNNTSVSRMKFLFEAYEPRCYGFELFETFRRLLLTGGQVYLKPGTASQIVINMLICLFSMRVYAKYKPFVDHKHDRLAEAAQWQLFFTMLAALCLKVEITTEDGYSQQMFDFTLAAIQLVAPALLIYQMFLQKGNGDTDGKEEFGSGAGFLGNVYRGRGTTAFDVFSGFSNRFRTKSGTEVKKIKEEGDCIKLSDIDNPVLKVGEMQKDRFDTIGVPMPPSDWAGYRDPKYKKNRDVRDNELEIIRQHENEKQRRRQMSLDGAGVRKAGVN